jgi:CheY-like chemotaxis protein
MNGSSDLQAHGRVLVVDADYDVLGALSRALRGRGHQVVLAADGRTGLSRAVEIAPEVVLVDQDLPVLDSRTFLEVLRDHPRTGAAHVFLMRPSESSRISIVDARAEHLVKPFNAEEVAARVDEVMRARRGPARDPELRGDLEQVALYDLLQVFSANRRTGRLELATPSAAGEVWVHEGRIVDVTYAGVVGEKALFRILTVTRGRFVFIPGVMPERVRIDASTDQLLMEGARQSDEVERIRKELPAPGALLRAAVRPSETSSIATQVMDALDEPRSIEEVLDLVPAHDLEVLRTIAELLERGALLVFDPRGERVRLASGEEAVTLRSAALKLRRPGLEGPVRLAVLARTSADVSRFARALARVDEFVAAAQAPTTAGDGALGALGHVRLDGLDVELFALPLDPALRPIWGPVLGPALVALVLGETTTDDDPDALLGQLEVHSVQAPAGWERPAGAVASIRLALQLLARRSSRPGSQAAR